MREFGASMPHIAKDFNNKRQHHEMPQTPSRPMRFPFDRLHSVLLIVPMAILLAIGGVKGDSDNGGDLLNGYSLGPEITTTEFGELCNFPIGISQLSLRPKNSEHSITKMPFMYAFLNTCHPIRKNTLP